MTPHTSAGLGARVERAWESSCISAPAAAEPGPLPPLPPFCPCWLFEELQCLERPQTLQKFIDEHLNASDVFRCVTCLGRLGQVGRYTVSLSPLARPHANLPFTTLTTGRLSFTWWQCTNYISWSLALEQFFMFLMWRLESKCAVHGEDKNVGGGIVVSWPYLLYPC